MDVTFWGCVKFHLFVWSTVRNTFLLLGAPDEIALNLKQDRTKDTLTWELPESSQYDKITVLQCDVETDQCQEHDVTNVTSFTVNPDGKKYNYTLLLYQRDDVVVTSETYGNGTGKVNNFSKL